MNRIAAMRIIQQTVLNYQDQNLLDETAGAIYDAVEPLIRADEREFLAPEVPMARDDLRNELRAQVEALQKQAIEASLKYNDHHLDGEAEAYTKVLTLIDGSDQ